ncbi:hypothetical protein CYLTODRAFT_486721 [Cylindrobasidium torrendii FP15055 ss-10]|uniref:Uncharacterized protein n=1 Tax=Cylindrobasidium torrendii FP15055 ss-10 TaxID=1314674 RepID=A0A0D7BP02_9AGAR|nr:hypothetical protein CYLTODRAFT_486721 [Cylindrobasidium torrendii FP15055 ss-10]
MASLTDLSTSESIPLPPSFPRRPLSYASPANKTANVGSSTKASRPSTRPTSPLSTSGQSAISSNNASSTLASYASYTQGGLRDTSVARSAPAIKTTFAEERMAGHGGQTTTGTGPSPVGWVSSPSELISPHAQEPVSPTTEERRGVARWAHTHSLSKDEASGDEQYGRGDHELRPTRPQTTTSRPRHRPTRSQSAPPVEREKLPGPGMRSPSHMNLPLRSGTAPIRAHGGWNRAGALELPIPAPPLHRPTHFWRHTPRSPYASTASSSNSQLVRRSTFIAAGLGCERSGSDWSATAVEMRTRLRVRALEESNRGIEFNEEGVRGEFHGKETPADIKARMSRIRGSTDWGGWGRGWLAAQQAGGVRTDFWEVVLERT